MAKFSDEEIKLAQKVQDTYGVPASVTLAQYAIESGYGKHTVGKNNYFNIKGNGNGGYRNYDSKEQSFMDFGKLLSGERYTSKTNGSKSALEYVQGVKDGGYAEDPNYVKKVMNIITSKNLTKYDSEGTWENGTHGGSGTSFAESSGSSGSGIGLEWWGDVVRVVLVLLIVAGGFIFMSMSVGQLGVDVPNVSKVLKGGK